MTGRTTDTATRAETIGASAVGGAALGSVTGIAIAVGTVVAPVVGTLLGALGGAVVGWLVQQRVDAKRIAAEGDTAEKEKAPQSDTPPRRMRV